jgi:hypothetical protein
MVIEDTTAKESLTAVEECIKTSERLAESTEVERRLRELRQESVGWKIRWWYVPALGFR